MNRIYLMICRIENLSHELRKRLRTRRPSEKFYVDDENAFVATLENRK